MVILNFQISGKNFTRATYKSSDISIASSIDTFYVNNFFSSIYTVFTFSTLSSE